MNAAEPPAEGDVIVVGAGIVGLAAARELALRHDGIRVVVLEREPRIAAHQTGRSSGVVHAGIYYRPGSLKARLCVAGARELYAYCDERGIPARRDGKLIVAASEDELARLDELERRGIANGVPGLRRIDAGDIPAIEPHARGLAALHSPATGVVDFARVARAFAADVAATRGVVATRSPVLGIDQGGGRIQMRHPSGWTTARAAVICAGAWGDRLAAAAGAPAEPQIVPFRGAYLCLRPGRPAPVRGSVYPVPDPDLPFLGAHLTRTINGETWLGPTALMVGALDAYRPWRIRPSDLARTLSWPGTWRLAARNWRAGAIEIAHAASKRSLVGAARRLIPDLHPGEFARGPAGIRAQAVARDGTLVDDFVVSQTDHALFIRNAPSPAATSALPLAREIADRLEPLLG